MRILLSIHHELEAHTGAPGATLGLRDGLRELGHETSCLSFDDMPVRLPFLAASIAYPYFVAAKLSGAAKRGIDVVDASTGDAWAWARLDRRSRRPLLVTRSHGLEHLFQAREVERIAREGGKMSWRYPLYWGGWRMREVAASLRSSDLVFALSAKEAQFMVERLGVAPERVRVTVNGVPSTFLERVGAVANPGGPRIAVLGAHRPIKGIDYGAEALAEALARDPELRVSFLGSGVPTAETLARFPEHLRHRVAITESYDRYDLPELLRGHSLTLFPSFSEGFSLALVEAMICGTAPVASAIPGNEDVVKDGVNGLLIPPGDAAAATAAILRLRSEPDLLGGLRTAAASIAARYSWSRIAADTAAGYAEALERRR